MVISNQSHTGSILLQNLQLVAHRFGFAETYYGDILQNEANQSPPHREEHKEDSLLKSSISIAGSKKSCANSAGTMSRGSKQD